MYQQAYRLRLTNVEGMVCEVRIYDTTSGLGTTIYTDIEAVKITGGVIDNDENPFSPIKAKELSVDFLSTSTVNLNTFFSSQDRQWYVEHYVNSVLQFVGYLLLDDINEDFLDSSTGNTVELIASDQLGLLSDVALLDENDDNPRGTFSLIQYVSWALLPTGLDLIINVANNLFEEDSPGTCLFETSYLNSKSFEDEINESISCLETLENILTDDCYITQYRGEWYIQRQTEQSSPFKVYYRYNSDGTPATPIFISTATTVHEIGPDEDLFFSEKTTFVKPQQPVIEVKETYPYRYWKEILDNIDFERGTFNAPLSGVGYSAYILDDWTFRYDAAGPVLTTVTTQGNAYVKKVFVDGYEKERYVVITQLQPFQLRLISNRIPMGTGDKFYCGIDFRYNVNISGTNTTTVPVMQVRLRGYDGTYWTLEGGGTAQFPEPFWVASNSGFTINNKYINSQWNSSLDETQWRSVSSEAAPVPTAGDLEVHITFQGGATGTVMNVANMQFTYIPLINGSYQKYEGQYHKISQSLNLRKTISNTVGISDSPKALFKYALLKYNGTRYILTERFYEGLTYGAVVPSDANLHPYGWHQAFAVWNMNQRPLRIFDFNIQGIQSLSGIPDIIDLFQILETSPHTTNKKFQVLHYEMDYDLCTMKGVMIEIKDSTLPKIFTSDHDFRYISERDN